jgi:hypothetical protein
MLIRRHLTTLMFHVVRVQIGDTIDENDAMQCNPVVRLIHYTHDGSLYHFHGPNQLVVVLLWCGTRCFRWVVGMLQPRFEQEIRFEFSAIDDDAWTDRRFVPHIVFAHFFDLLRLLTMTKTKTTAPRSSSPVRKKRKSSTSENSKASSTSPKPLIFQDVMQQLSENSNDNEEESDVSLAFFELANAPTIAYRLPSKKQIVLQQDVTACGEHTGGIVWETSFLLLDYLLQLKSASTEQYQSLGRTLEVGAGCGLLGQVLAAANCSSEMIVTETEQVLVNLQANLERNSTVGSSSSSSPIRACCLDWEHYERDAAANNILPNSCDTILGTDVLFATRFVRPLLQTLQYMSILPVPSDTSATAIATDTTKTVNIYLCVQIRCAASHELFLEEAPSFGFDVHDISDECFAVPSCAWGRDLECKVFRMTTTAAGTATEDTSTTATALVR